MCMGVCLCMVCAWVYVCAWAYVCAWVYVCSWVYVLHRHMYVRAVYLDMLVRQKSWRAFGEHMRLAKSIL